MNRTRDTKRFWKRVAPHEIGCSLVALLSGRLRCESPSIAGIRFDEQNDSRAIPPLAVDLDKMIMKHVKHHVVGPNRGAKTDLHRSGVTKFRPRERQQRLIGAAGGGAGSHAHRVQPTVSTVEERRDGSSQ
jgi:hypothetical protein